MDIGGVSRTSPAVNSQFAARQDVAQSAGAVRTDLVPTKSVQQATAIPEEAVRYDMRDPARDTAQRLAALRSFIERNYEFDVSTREIVYRAVDTRTGQIVRQFPDDISLKLRGFVKEINDKQNKDNAEQSDVPHVMRII
jgi:uncharacterized FlaG/YvyC family protein